MSEHSTTTSADVVALAEELGAIRRRVLNVIGHELRTPATTIQGLARQVCDGAEPDVIRDEVGPALVRNADRLMVLLDQMLIAAGIQTAIPVGASEPVELSALVAERWAATGQPPLELLPAATTIQAPPGPLQIVLDAVLDNAANYGTAPPEVRIHQLDDTTSLVVLSPGPALHPEELRLAAEPFFRGERAVTSRPGLGLGLAIVRAVVEHLGGTLRISQDDEGLVTTITLPTQGIG